MKRTSLVEQNQRIEQITDTTLVIGVDIAKELHAGQAVNYRGMVLTEKTVCFSNALDGFERLASTIRTLQQEHGMTDVIVGLESTGHYWWNLATWLVEQGIKVVIVSPMATKRNKENRDNCPSKSDPKDALVIAELVSRGYYTEFRPQDALFGRLRDLMGDREFWVTECVRFRNQIIRWLDIRFPEYTVVFGGDLFCPRSLVTLRQFPAPSDLAGLTPEQVVASWGNHMRRPGGARGLGKARELVKQARQSVGRVDALDEAKWHLARLLDTYEQIEKHLEETEKKAVTLVAELPIQAPTTSLGLPPTLTAALWAFGGDLRQFEHGNQLLRKAGLNLAERRSGKYKGQIKLSKRGNARLRKYLFLAVLYLVKNHPDFRRWHHENVEVKRMKKMRSLMKLMGKLARILVALARKGEKVQPTVRAA